MDENPVRVRRADVHDEGVITAATYWSQTKYLYFV